jgi:hypothetical protein
MPAARKPRCFRPPPQAAILTALAVLLSLQRGIAKSNFGVRCGSGSRPGGRRGLPLLGAALKALVRGQVVMSVIYESCLLYMSHVSYI